MTLQSHVDSIAATRVTWVFRNDHEWSKDFASVAERDTFINSVGLVSHPDIVRVTVQIGEEHRDLKRVG